MESIRRVYPHLPIVQSCPLEVGQRITPQTDRGVKARNTGRDSYRGHLEFRGIFGLGFLLVLIAYKKAP